MKVGRQPGRLSATPAGPQPAPSAVWAAAGSGRGSPGEQSPLVLVGSRVSLAPQGEGLLDPGQAPASTYVRLLAQGEWVREMGGGGAEGGRGS